jgi:hypothetical protein
LVFFETIFLLLKTIENSIINRLIISRLKIRKNDEFRVILCWWQP